MRRFVGRRPAGEPAAGEPGGGEPLPPAGAAGAPPRPRRRRDRRGRGMRGPLAPPEAPLSLTRAERFDELVRDAIEDLEGRWAGEIEGVEFAVADVPPPEDPVPLGVTLPAHDDQSARIVIYRRPVEARAADEAELADLVHDVVVEQVADLLGLEPGTIDPDYDGDER